MDLTRLELPETERQLSLYISRFNVDQPLTRGEDLLVKSQREFDLHVAREKHLQLWSEDLEHERASSVPTEDQIDESLASLQIRCQRFQNDCLDSQDRTGPCGDILSIETFISKLADKYRVMHGEKAQGSTTALKSLHRMLNTLNAHKVVLQIIPSQNNYASIVYGVVQTFLKASANHHRITETIGKVIAEVNDMVAHVHRLFGLFPNEDMRRMATTLYCYIFDFFEKVFKWYESRWHRFKRSFSDDTVEKLLDLTVEIKRYVQILDRRAMASNMIESRVTNLRVEQIYEILKMIPSVWAQHFFEGKDFIHMNVGRGKTLLDGQDSSDCETLLTERSPSPQLFKSDSRRAISEAGSPRMGYGTDDEYEDSAAIYVEERIIQDVHKWLLELHARFLWIEAPQTTEGRSLSRLIGRSIAYSARQSGAPVLYHACTDAEGIESISEPPGIIGFRQLLQSLNDQLRSFAKSSQASFNSTPPSSQTFSSLDDLIFSFRQNLATAPPLLLCIIEDFQHLDDPFEDNTHLKQFFLLLREHGSPINQDRQLKPSILKVLASTSGHSKTLREVLEPEEICFCDHSQRGLLYPGQAAPGRRPLMSNLLLINDWMSGQTPESPG